MITDELNALIKDFKITKEESDTYLLFVVDTRGNELYKKLLYNTMMSAVIQPDPTMIAINYGRREVFMEFQETIDRINKQLEELRYGKSSSRNTGISG